MAFTRRLTALSCVVGFADARIFQAGSGGAGGWAPVTPTGAATPNPEGSIPRTTQTPEPPSEIELRKRRDITNGSTCGYVLNGLADQAITCDDGSQCNFNRRGGIVGCCSEKFCDIPTACLDSTSTRSSRATAVGSLTTSCGDSDRPYCVTLTYNVDFIDDRSGASFVGCAAEAATDGSEIGTTPGPLNSSSSSSSSKTLGTTTGPATITVTVGPSGDSTITPGASSSSSHSGSKNVGAIVGGVIGGLAGLAIIIAAILFFLYRRRRRSREDEMNPPLGRKMPPSDNDIYPNEGIPGSQYPSTFYGDPPPGMIQRSNQPELGYPQHAAYANPNQMFSTGHNYSSEAPSYFHPAAAPLKPNEEDVSPIEPSPVSPVSPAENYNTMVSALSNPSPPLQPLQPSHRQSDRHSDYLQYSPPPPQQFQSYRPYPGT